MAEPRDMRSRDARRDDYARFLRELRELRSHAGLDHAELAARAHYPCDVIKAAEAGPSLPDLPVLSAYVRGCGGVLAEWEERWRAITGSPATPLLTARTAGCSEAADAGARVGAVSAAADAHDPDRVMAALNRVVDGMAAAASSASAPSGATGSMLTGQALSSPSLSGPALSDAALSDAALSDAALSDAGLSDPAVSDTGISHGALPGATGFDVWQPRRTVPGAWASRDPIFDEAVFEELAAGPPVPNPAPATDAAVWDPAVWDPARAAGPPPWDSAPATGAPAWDSVPLTDGVAWNGAPATDAATWGTKPPAPSANYPAPPAVARGAATPMSAATDALRLSTRSGASPAPIPQADGPKLPRAVLITVGLLLVVIVLVLFA